MVNVSPVEDSIESEGIDHQNVSPVEDPIESKGIDHRQYANDAQLTLVLQTSSLTADLHKLEF